MWDTNSVVLLALSPCVLIQKYLLVAGLDLGLEDLALASWFWPQPRPQSFGLSLDILASFNITVVQTVNLAPDHAQ